MSLCMSETMNCIGRLSVNHVNAPPETGNDDASAKAHNSCRAFSVPAKSKMDVLRSKCTSFTLKPRRWFKENNASKCWIKCPTIKVFWHWSPACLLMHSAECPGPKSRASACHVLAVWTVIACSISHTSVSILQCSTHECSTVLCGIKFQRF